MAHGHGWVVTVPTSVLPVATDAVASIRGDVAVVGVGVIILAALALTRPSARRRASSGGFPVFRLLIVVAGVVYGLQLIYGGH
jgi:hypothetical protein